MGHLRIHGRDYYCKDSEDDKDRKDDKDNEDDQDNDDMVGQNNIDDSDRSTTTKYLDSIRNGSGEGDSEDIDTVRTVNDHRVHYGQKIHRVVVPDPMVHRVVVAHDPMVLFLGMRHCCCFH